MVIYKRIRDLREDKDLTQKELANYLNVTQKSYSRYETTVDYLLGRTNDKTDYTKKENRSKHR